MVVGEQDLKGGRHLFYGCTSADIKEIGRPSTIVPDHIHGRHGQTGSVYQAADISVQADIADVMLGSAYFLFIFLGIISEGGNIRMVVNRDRKMHLRIVISNTGDTIPPEALQKIFERFYRVDPARSRDTGGYGLGLCVAKSIAELHGGAITATSENGINVFTVILGYIITEDVKN